MTTKAEQRARHQEYLAAVRAGQAAAAGLIEALARVGVTIPSLRASEPVAGNAFVELGGCNAGTATMLAEVINAAADAVPGLRVATR
ncbi:hypothetical protein [Streptomyces sp. NBC_01304]|uniref:hypothetical protein n=1 Tax=Streptomyces sp. NBC_01304 TaxID=2903818 RepID=UPI002E10E913|nr:hypothetical protein OG430_49245 [Streptomyces sp. NBC_01304]